MRRVPILVLLPLLMIGCGARPGRTPVRVLDDVSGEPIAGARIITFVPNFFGTPSPLSPEFTDQEGRAVIPRAGVYTVDVSATGYSEVNPNDRPNFADDERLLYVRPTPRVVLGLPADFRGPVLIDERQATQALRQPVYVVRLTERWEPAEVPGRDSALVNDENLFLDIGGEAIARGDDQDDADTLRVWRPCRHAAAVDGRHVSIRFVGTRAERDRFDRLLRERIGGRSGLLTISPAALAELNAAATG